MGQGQGKQDNFDEDDEKITRVAQDPQVLVPEGDDAMSDTEMEKVQSS